MLHGVPLTEINKTHNAIANIGIDSYTVTLTTSPVISGGSTTAQNGGDSVTENDKLRINQLFTEATQALDQEDFNATIDLYVLSYDVTGKLITTPEIISTNLKNYLSQFRLLTDKIRIMNGFNWKIKLKEY